MIYKIKTNEITKLDTSDLKVDLDGSFVVGLLSVEEFFNYVEKEKLSKSVINELNSNEDLLKNTLYVSENYSFGKMSILNKDNILGNKDTIAFYISDSLFLTVVIVDDDSSCENAFNKTIENLNLKNPSLGKVISSYLKNLILEQNDVLYNLQRKVENLDERILHSRKDDFTFEIADLNHELLSLYGYYEQLIELGVSLMENDNDIIEEEQLMYIRTFVNRADRYLDQVKLLREYVVQVRESYQAQLDLGMNNVMKVLTVLTAIFSPLALITGWYGMNFKHMPELEWKYSYLGLIVFCVILVILLIRFLNKNDMTK